MCRIREVDGQDEEIAETLAELHRLTFFDSARMRSSIGVIGGLRVRVRFRSLLPVWFRQRTPAMQDISAVSVCCVSIAAAACGYV
jgi:hypothetical protein